MPSPLHERLAGELSIRPQQALATIALLDGGATVPFIARYRKEATQGLDDTQLRELADRLGYLRELDARREAILESIEAQGKLTPALAAQIDAADSKQRLEDLYAPYKVKRRTKAQLAREAGLEALADLLLSDPTRNPEQEALAFLKPPFATPDGDNPGVADVKAALEGARHVLMDRFAEDANLLARLRETLQSRGVLVSRVADGKAEAGVKFADYFDYREPIKDVPSHRALALLRGRREEVLALALRMPEDLEDEAAAAASGERTRARTAPGRCEQMIAGHFGLEDLGRPADAWLRQAVRWTWQVKLAWQMETELLGALRERAEEEAIRVFGRNLQDLLLAAPAGRRVTMGLDPGLRTGVKVAVVDATGKLVETSTIHPHAPRNDWEGALATLAALAARHQVELVAIGNGTASRETEKLVAELARRHPQARLTRAVVSEAGASVYSASELAAREFPELDVSLRGAVSIARRLQDPLAELVKIDPKAIGVGQYQHDVSQTRLARQLDAVVEDCVNGVGVDVNMASAQLLARIAGLTPSLAENIVKHRDTHGAFRNRKSLLAVSRLGERAFEQAAGFLRVNDGDDPLDASGVHPEAYPLVKRMLADIAMDAREVMGRQEVIARLRPEKYVDDRFGLPTVRDILQELEKPGRDPRPEFRTASFREGVEKLTDLEPGMILEGVVTNVANFGAFVDIGVHQDGLVHVSALSSKFVRDPREVVRTGDLVRVKVMEVDPKRQRIGLSMRLDDEPGAPARRQPGERGGTPGNRGGRDAPSAKAPAPAPMGALAAALAAARKAGSR
ncbi:MAG: RNA-binding transcriptional accessory protein [Burkholderiaceae bacterium]|nr:RNA-binding transcriptional accessory protein [Burkholderiaceae bacterium]